MSGYRKRSHRSKSVPKNEWLKEMLLAFWNEPEFKCPKCGSDSVRYYDPFFFAPIRTLKGKRRLKCSSCHFIWRPSRNTQSIWERYKL